MASLWWFVGCCGGVVCSDMGVVWMGRRILLSGVVGTCGTWLMATKRGWLTGLLGFCLCCALRACFWFMVLHVSRWCIYRWHAYATYPFASSFIVVGSTTSAFILCQLFYLLFMACLRPCLDPKVLVGWCPGRSHLLRFRTFGDAGEFSLWCYQPMYVRWLQTTKKHHQVLNLSLPFQTPPVYSFNLSFS